MAHKRKNPLPTSYPGEAIAAPKVDKEWEARERRYKAKEALETLTRADEYRKDKALMKEVKAMANQMVKCVK